MKRRRRRSGLRPLFVVVLLTLGAGSVERVGAEVLRLLGGGAHA